MSGPSEVMVATFNVHAGVDGWGRYFDVVSACEDIGADVLVLQETWSPDSRTSFVQELAESAGYQVIEGQLGRGWSLTRDHLPAPGTGSPRWSPPLMRNVGGPHLEPVRGRAEPAMIERGSVRVSLLSKLPLRRHEVIDLPKLPRDRSRRKALLVEVGPEGKVPLTVVGTHLSHLEKGSPLQMRVLYRALTDISGPIALMGDMNCWGPLLLTMFPGWRRAAFGRTYPAWKPHSQIDHILVRGDLAVRDGEVLALPGSDHRPVRARLSW